MTTATRANDAASQRKELIDWFLRRNGPQWTDADERAFLQWLAVPGNQNAYTQWQADWDLMAALPQESTARLRTLMAADRQAASASSRKALPQPPRRRSLISGLALTSVAGVALSAGWLGWLHFQAQPVYEQAYTTRKGQRSEVRLADGSALQLDTATSAKAIFYRDRREVRLAHGQAKFSVASDAQKPFRVVAADVQITVIGTVFAVRLTPGVPGREGVEVVVQEGQVRVEQAHALQEASTAEPWDRTAQAFELTAGQKLVFPSDGKPPQLASAPADSFANWRSAQLSFSDVTLREALGEMERYTDLGIADVEPSAAHLRLTGTFNPTDANAVRRVLVNALPIRFERGEHGLEVRLVR